MINEDSIIEIMEVVDVTIDESDEIKNRVTLSNGGIICFIDKVDFDKGKLELGKLYPVVRVQNKDTYAFVVTLTSLYKVFVDIISLDTNDVSINTILDKIYGYKGYYHIIKNIVESRSTLECNMDVLHKFAYTDTGLNQPYLSKVEDILAILDKQVNSIDRAHRESAYNFTVGMLITLYNLVVEFKLKRVDDSVFELIEQRDI